MQELRLALFYTAREKPACHDTKHEQESDPVIKEEVVMRYFDFFFGCPHRRTTFPRARLDRRGKVIHPQVNYVACLDCGAEFDYDAIAFDPQAEADTRAARPRLKETVAA